MPILRRDTRGEPSYQPGGTLEALMQAQSQPPQQPDPRGVGSFIRPVDQSVLGKIQAALGEGLDPQTAMTLMAAVGGGVDQRFDAFRDRRAQQQAMQREQMMGLPALAGQAFEFAQGGVPESVTQSAFSGYGGQAGNTLEGIVGGIYGAPGASTLTDEDTTAFVTIAMKAIDEAKQAGGSADFQTVFWGTGVSPGIQRQLKAAGYIGEDFEAAKAILQKQWASLGGQPQVAAPMAAPTPVPAPVPRIAPQIGNRGAFPAAYLR
jgi:hypothetical protein